jgi:hypothetical protein
MGAGMTAEVAGMTAEVAGMTARVAGMTTLILDDNFILGDDDKNAGIAVAMGVVKRALVCGNFPDGYHKSRR